MSNISNKKLRVEDRIVVKGHPALATRAREILPEEIGKPHLNGIIKVMREQLKTQDDGVAIAAPQIGESLRVFVVSPNAFHGNQKDNQTVFINPKIIKFSKDKKYMLEGCLSIRWLYGEVERSKQVTIESLDEHGKKHIRGAGGLMAQIFQHEVDHLNGILFDSKATNLRDLPPEMHIKKHE